MKLVVNSGIIRYRIMCAKREKKNDRYVEQKSQTDQ